MARKMKDSGIEWIGEIPEGWKTQKLKYYATVTSGEILSRDEYDFSGDIPVIGSNGKIGTTYKSNNHSEVITTGRVGTIGTAQIVQDAWITDNALIIKSHSINRPFLTYVIPNFDFKFMLSGTAQPLITATKLKNQYIPVPSSEVQDKLVQYLNTQIFNLSHLISQACSSIELYKKLKQAVITQAVTKGVHGEREMKDSGVEWIGKIPREFDPVQLKFFCKLITDGTHFSPTTVENGWPYITAGDVHGIGLDYNSAKRISEENFQLLVAQGCQPLKGDVLLVKDGATTGRVGFVDSDTPCVILSSVAMLRPADNTDGHYLMYLLASDFLQKQILVSMAGSAMPRTTLTKLTKYIGLLPPLHEQKEIANYLDAKCAEIDGLVAKKEQLVKELESYKKSLIYEVVTGKREV
mgnify:CR=1 FL=1